MTSTSGETPRRHRFPEGDETGELVRLVQEALNAVPAHFRTTARIDGLDANDLFSLNTVMGNTIEVQVVETLNRIRHVWDPSNHMPGHRFVRSAQTFPDVRLLAPEADGVNAAVLGIELKGWYLLSREGEPSFRYTVSPNACAPQDLLVVVPWHLEYVLSGEPVVHKPYVEQARYIATYRNWWWTNVRNTTDATNERRVSPPDQTVHPYPEPKTKIADQPVKDGGSNFGRVARLEDLMNDYILSMRDQEISGIPAKHWIEFFKLHAETRDPRAIFDRLRRKLAQDGRDDEAATEVMDAVSRIVDQFR